MSATRPRPARARARDPAASLATLRLPSRLVTRSSTTSDVAGPQRLLAAARAREHETSCRWRSASRVPRCRRLYLSTSTVKTHLHNAKPGVDDRATAVAEGMRRRLLS